MKAQLFSATLLTAFSGVLSAADPQLLNPWGISVLPGQDFLAKTILRHRDSSVTRRHYLVLKA